MKRSWFVSIVLLLFAAASHAQNKEVSFSAADGFALKGTFYPVEKGGPGILVLHECNADRRGYDNLATMLSTAGYNVLTFDFRMDKTPGDVDSALRFLTSQSTVNPRALGVVGGSCGANQAVQAGRRHPEIRTLVLLSGGTDGDGETYIKGSPKVPILGVASEEDTTAAAATRKAVGLSANPDSRVEMFKGAGHAASMFARQPDLEADIVIWFRYNLPTAGYGLPPALK